MCCDGATRRAAAVIIWLWIGFLAFVLLMLALDLGVFHRRGHVVGVSEAAIWTTVWAALAVLFSVVVHYLYQHQVFGIGEEYGDRVSGGQAALEFFTGYVIEKSLSLDNIFVIALIFSYFGVRAEHQHRVLFWGILGAVVLRGLMIAAGTALIQRFSWITYVFGGLLLVTAFKMLVARHDTLKPERNPIVRLARRWFPVADYDGQRFFTRLDGRRAITPLFIVLLVVESFDVLFAVDSIPAIFAVTQDPFLVFTSNIFAILGLRSLYFVLAGVLDKFRYLKLSLVVLLAYVGVKMLLAHHYPIPIPVSLGIIGGILSIGVVASLIARAPPPAAELQDLAVNSAKQLRRLVVVLVGTAVLLVGIAMIVLPGPAIVMIPAGLAILGTELLWARGLLAKITGAGNRGGKRSDDSQGPPPQGGAAVESSEHKRS